MGKNAVSLFASSFTLTPIRSWAMLKRFALMVAATAVLVVPASSAFAAPRPSGALPEEACLAAYPQAVQPAFCGEGNGGPGKA